MKARNKFIYTGLAILLFLLHFGIFVVCALWVNIDYEYLYPAVSNQRYFWMTIAIVVIVPLLLCIVAIATLSRHTALKKRIAYWLCIVALFILLPISFFSAAIMRCGITSHTMDVNHYAKLDSAVINSCEYQEYGDILPEIGSQSNVISYEYDYDYGAVRECYRIRVEVAFVDKSAYKTELNRIGAFDMKTDSVGKYRFSNDTGRVDIAINTDDDQKTIQYVFACGYGTME